MIAIVGAAGKVGHSTSRALRQAGVSVRAIVRDATQGDHLRAIGCDVAVADLRDAGALAVAFEGVRAAQIILPPPPRADDAKGEMHRSIESMAEALERARPERVMAISDYGAHVATDIGMPTLFRHFEERLRRLPMAKVFLRSAEHMEGWGLFAPVAAASGVLPSLHHPVDAVFPTVSAADVGAIAADLLLRARSTPDVRVVHVEGPRRYSATDVATALSELLGRAITAQPLPRSQWKPALQRALSESAAKLVVDLYDAHNAGGLVDAEPGGDVRRGATELIDALRPLASSPEDAK